MIRFLRGDSLSVLQTLPSESVHCCVTSPPYWMLRSYSTEPQQWPDGWRGELGQEPTPELYIEHLVAVFRECRRVLRSDGTLWVNVGDSFASGKGTCFNPGGGAKSYIQEKERYPLNRGNKSTLAASGLKPKDLVGVPWMLAFALRADGWWLRQDVIWQKRAPMPESVTDRCTRSHEHIFMFSKSQRYYYDAMAVAEPAVQPDRIRADVVGGDKGDLTHHSCGGLFSGGATRNRRDVWTLSPSPFRGAHFATFPEELPRLCILAGTSERGCCPECGAPWERVTSKGMTAHDGDTESAYPKGTTANRLALLRQAARERGEEYVNQVVTTGWRPTCDHAGEPVPCVVLDPFSGAGTTCLVAERLGRDSIGVELNPTYIALAQDRIVGELGPMTTIQVAEV